LWAIILSGMAVAVMLVAFAGSLYPVPPFPYSWLPYIFAVLLTAGMASSFAVRSRSARVAVCETL
jgi:hypothetical protein